MGAIFKVLNTFLGVLAIIMCLAAVCVIVYSIVRPDFGRFRPDTVAIIDEEEPGEESETEEPEDINSEHIHEFIEEIYEEPTCVDGGRTIFVCDCGDYYFEKIPATGHNQSDWQLVVVPTTEREGERIRTCLVCNETIASEWLPMTPEASPIPSPHVHSYVASILSQPTCTEAGIRLFSCTCGSFYQENIHAIGHLAADWAVVTEPTVDRVGVRQRICNVCHTMIDSQQISRLSPTASSSPGASPGGSPGASPGGSPGASPGGSPSGSPSPSPVPSPHTCSFIYYVSRVPTCTQIGSSTGNCVCGKEDLKPIPIDKNNHSFNVSGNCVRCGVSRNASPSPSP